MARLFAVFVCSLFFGQAALAQDPSAAARPVRVVIASERLASVVEAPMHFKMIQVSIARGQTANYSGPSGYLYALSGRAELSAGGTQRSLSAGEAAYVGAGESANLHSAGSAPAVLLHFMLLPAAALESAPYSGTAKVAELYRSPERFPRLETGPYEFSLTKVTSPPKVKPPLHQRSGAAVYYVLDGAGILHMDGKSEPRNKGAVQYEPNGFVHTWENAGTVPLILLQANISREGAPEIVLQR